MKTFFKKNLYIIILLSAGVLCLFLTPIFAILMPISMVIFATPMIILAVRYKKIYNKMKVIDTKQNYFDATKLDFDEDVYYIGTQSEKKIRLKAIASKYKASYPVIIFGFLALALISIAIMGFLNIL